MPSSFALLEWHEGDLVFVDPAIMVEPSEQELAEVAALTAFNAGTLLGIAPRIAFMLRTMRGWAATASMAAN